MSNESFFNLDAEAKLSFLLLASEESSRNSFYLEKDIWIVWTLKQLFNAPFGGNLVFKGGTSLSKAYDIIDRFSEDIDITYDIRTIASDLTAESEIPQTNSQAKKWTKEIRSRLAIWVENEVKPMLENALRRYMLEAVISVDDHVLSLEYNPLTEATSDYVEPIVLLEFGARSTGEPTNDLTVSCDADLPRANLMLPEAQVRVMTAERTFWEKASAIHTICVGGRIHGRGHFARHWYDLMRLDKAGISDQALADRTLALKVAEHQSVFFREKDGEGNWINFREAVQGSLMLVPKGEKRNIVQNDYDDMVEVGMLYSDVPSFDELMDRLSDIERRANSV